VVVEVLLQLVLAVLLAELPAAVVVLHPGLEARVLLILAVVVEAQEQAAAALVVQD
jgi:hypothetical protein